MQSLLLELGTEELPPRSVGTLSAALAEGIVKGLDAAGVAHGAAQTFATPRRLAVRVAACAAFAAPRRIERRGPPVAAAFDAAGAPTQAAMAFARSCGVEVGELERLTTDKGVWLAFRATEPGAATAQLLPGIVAEAVRALPIAKRMRWGDHSAEFVRPVRSVLLLHGSDVIDAEVLGLRTGRLTSGHRLHHPQPLRVRSASTYEGQLSTAHVIADVALRRAKIRDGVLAAAADSGGIALIEESLLDEVTALVEWPVALAGRFEARFLSLPREVVIATIQDHQRYFPIQDQDGRLSGGFVTVCNLESRDPTKIREGNERVVRPRLADATFFWDQDRKESLDDHAAKLAGLIFQTRLGSYAEKQQRVGQLAESVAARLQVGGAVRRAAHLAKADLMTAMVGEFPELQGIMGRYYAAAQGEEQEVARAIEEHYRPRFAGDALPHAGIAQALALADKLDTLAGIFAIEQRPSGTKDPFGLRRATLGILRIVLEGRLELDLGALLREAAALQPVQRSGVVEEMAEFVAERLRGIFLERDQVTAEMVDAVLVGRPASPLDAESRLAALQGFLALPAAATLTALNKRIVNILRKTTVRDEVAVRPSILGEDAEIDLHAAIAGIQGTASAALAERRYTDALRTVSALVEPVDRFFATILVMDADPLKRENRLALLRDVRGLLNGVADLSRLPG